VLHQCAHWLLVLAVAVLQTSVVVVAAGKLSM
jgi:hypothetical protein